MIAMKKKTFIVWKSTQSWSGQALYSVFCGVLGDPEWLPHLLL